MTVVSGTGSLRRGVLLRRPIGASGLALCTWSREWVLIGNWLHNCRVPVMW
ncbi:MAG: hypothetical protein J7M26_09620 [Armatimonadetes bacterium]|nr:hypothetical protein [Armatimonadota bacterium]